ncbi:MAG TPA: protein translocase subunit SecD [Clostridiales bacterium]|nr:MAG: protein-export membrane protein SecD [Clostridiales bacterium GWD2_32_59]HAN09995.1 protein translocase subunit SecD [Clostridiales bacterium]
MKAKSLLKILGILLVIAIIGYMVLSGKVITIGGEEKKVETKNVEQSAENKEVVPKTDGAVAPDVTTTNTPVVGNEELATTIPIAKPAPVVKEATVDTEIVTVPAETATATIAPTTTGAKTVAPAGTPDATPAKTTVAAPEITTTGEDIVEPTVTTPTPTTTTAAPVKQAPKKPLLTFNNPLSYQHINLGLDLKGGVSIVYEAGIKNPSKEDMDSAVELLRKRLNEKNYTEAEVSLQGSNRIRVEIPGIGDPNKAVSEIGRTAELKFYGITDEQFKGIQTDARKEVEALFAQLGMTATEEQIQGMMPTAIIQGIQQKGELVLRGKDISRASMDYEQASQVSPLEPVVKLEMTPVGTKKFANATKKYINNYIVILLDNDILSMPKVNVEIDTGSAVITGMEGEKEAKSVAELINSGALPFELRDIQRTAIEARLGQDALAGSIKAGIIGALLVLVFMFVMYRFPGIVADIALVGYVFLVLAAFSLFNVTLTLPGIAGMILSIGMAVDANVIIFSRLKEELNAGKTTRAAMAAGFKKAMSAIIDGNATTFIIALILYWFGTGPIKGFGQTLMIGLIVSMFTALIVTKILLNSFVDLGVKNPTLFGARLRSKTVMDLKKK